MLIISRFQKEPFILVVTNILWVTNSQYRLKFGITTHPGTQFFYFINFSEEVVVALVWGETRGPSPSLYFQLDNHRVHTILLASRAEIWGMCPHVQHVGTSRSVRKFLSFIVELRKTNLWFQSQSVASSQKAAPKTQDNLLPSGRV